MACKKEQIGPYMEAVKLGQQAEKLPGSCQVQEEYMI
jgi:hypothetical protein